jgi:hypothetical protein
MNLMPNNFKVATLRLDLDCALANVKLGTRMMPPSFLDLTDSESGIQTPASHSDGRAVNGSAVAPPERRRWWRKFISRNG